MHAGVQGVFLDYRSTKLMSMLLAQLFQLRVDHRASARAARIRFVVILVRFSLVKRVERHHLSHNPAAVGLIQHHRIMLIEASTRRLRRCWQWPSEAQPLQSAAVSRDTLYLLAGRHLLATPR